MADSIYSASGTQRISSVCLQHTVNRATLLIDQADHNNYPDQKYSAVIAVTGGNSVLVSGVTGSRIMVDSYLLVASGAGTVRFLSSTGTPLMGTAYLAANQDLSVNDANLLTNSGENLVLNTSATVGGHITYRLI